MGVLNWAHALLETYGWLSMQKEPLHPLAGVSAIVSSAWSELIHWTAALAMTDQLDDWFLVLDHPKTSADPVAIGATCRHLDVLAGSFASTITTPPPFDDDPLPPIFGPPAEEMIALLGKHVAMVIGPVVKPALFITSSDQVLAECKHRALGILRAGFRSLQSKS